MAEPNLYQVAAKLRPAIMVIRKVVFIMRTLIVANDGSSAFIPASGSKRHC